MHICILGIGGTFMGGIACLAAQKGFQVSGMDENVYPPMSTQLAQLNVAWHPGYDVAWLQKSKPDLVVIGNVMKRGNPVVEYVLDAPLPYISGPEWLAKTMLPGRWVIGVAGTHGKTTVSSMIAWVLFYAQRDPGFLIGGIPENFGVSARCGTSPFFVVEADEYDSAFFDKRSKFVHYHPKTCVLNNLEFDHADIFHHLDDIKRQFHHLIRTIPRQGRIIVPLQDEALQSVLKMGCWSEIQYFGPNGLWEAGNITADGSSFEVYCEHRCVGTVRWPLIGKHNVQNGLAAIAALHHAGIAPETAIEALGQFRSVKRRMERVGAIAGITIYDDFAHHPSAIEATVSALRAKVRSSRIVAVLDLRSNTMCMGQHKDALAPALVEADEVCIYQSKQVTWNVQLACASLGTRLHIFNDIDALVQHLIARLSPQDNVLIMSNGSFEHFPVRLSDALSKRVVISRSEASL